MPSHSDGNIPQRLAEDTAESKGQIGPDDLMENALQTLLLRTADFEKKLAELSTKIDSALTNSKVCGEPQQKFGLNQSCRHLILACLVISRYHSRKAEPTCRHSWTLQKRTTIS